MEFVNYKSFYHVILVHIFHDFQNLLSIAGLVTKKPLRCKIDDFVITIFKVSLRNPIVSGETTSFNNFFAIKLEIINLHAIILYQRIDWHEDKCLSSIWQYGWNLKCQTFSIACW